MSKYLKFTIFNHKSDIKITLNDKEYKFTDLLILYQAGKTNNDYDFMRFSTLVRLKDAQKLSKLINIRDDWKTYRYEFMYHIIKAKFKQNKELYKWLLDTGDTYLIEIKTNKNWSDNKIGKIIMKIRDEFKNTKYLL